MQRPGSIDNAADPGSPLAEWSLVDCMIAAVAWRRGAALLSCDADLDRVAQVIGIEPDEALLRA